MSAGRVAPRREGSLWHMRATMRRIGRRAAIARRLPAPGRRSIVGARTLDRDGPVVPVVRAGVRGVVAAMAMTGMREVTTGLGLVKHSPPDAVVDKASGLVGRVSADHRRVVVQLLHWGYGAAGGAAFGLLPRPVRSRTLAGPVYGLLSWLVFELGVAPLLGLPQAKRPDLAESAALAADHVLYGTMVGASGWAQRS